MANINKIKLSGTTYSIQDENATKTVELTQAEYDALSVKDPNTFYIITDAQAGDLSNYYTKTQVDTALASKQNTLVSGTNIKTINNESILGSGNIEIEGGGSSYTAGRGIDITNDTISVSLPISAGTGSYSIIEGSNTTASGRYSHAEGYYSNAQAEASHAEGHSTARESYCHSEGFSTTAYAFRSHAEGSESVAYGDTSHAEGKYTRTSNHAEHASGRYNVSSSASTTFGDSGNTLFSVGNGTADNARHNAFEIRQNGDIYITKDGADVKLQDQLGGGGGSYSAGTGIDITNDVISVTGKASTSDVFITSSNRNSIVSNIHEEVYQLSTDDIYSISATKGQSSDTVWCQIMVDNVLYTMSGSSTSITYSDAALSSLVTADFSSNMSVTLNDRENHHINEIFFECYNNDDNSYIKEITIVHNPPIGANKIDYVAGIYTEFVHDKYAHKIDLNNKQDTLVSGTNIKTINNQSLLGSGNITIEGGTIDTTITSGSTNAVTSAAIYNQFGGLKLQKITQSAYDALVTKDANTLYVING